MTKKCLVVGYSPRDSVLYEDLQDFPVGMALNWEEVKSGVYLGTMPPGLILQIPGGEPCVLVGHYGNLEVVPLLKHVMEERAKK